jgi:predicted RNA-binding Zn ribbon-like protein
VAACFDSREAMGKGRRGKPGVVEWVATARFGLRPAAGGLALVQDFLNTAARAPHIPDLLGDTAQAREWSKHIAGVWSLQRGVQTQVPALNSRDVAELRKLRRIVGALLSRESYHAAATDLGAAGLTLSRDGQLHWQPTESGWRWWAAAVCSEVLLSQHNGTWQRLKQCGNPDCPVVFYDRSWDRRFVLHAYSCTGASPSPDRSALG